MASYTRLAKPRQTLLLSYSSIISFILAVLVERVGFSIKTFSLSAISIILAVMGANSINNYLDREIDAVMSRTKDRPLPRGEISPPEKAFIYGISLTVLGAALSYTINMVTFLIMLSGVLIDLVIYAHWLKRRNP